MKKLDKAGHACCPQNTERQIRWNYKEINIQLIN